MMKHTPGPWAVVEVPHTGLIGVQRGDRVLNLDHDQEADACLIAAAPELLEALEKFVDNCEFVNQEYSDLREAEKLARAAIAKARGEQ